MLKKIAFAIALIALPMVGTMAQLKFGHVNSQEVIIAMPEFTKAQSDLEALAKQYQTEMDNGEAELNKKYQEYLQQADSLPKNIADRRQKEIQDMAQRQQQFQQEASQAMQQAQEEALTPIYKKVQDAITAVGDAEGVIYIFDLARTSIPYVGSQSIDLTAKVKAKVGL